MNFQCHTNVCVCVCVCVWEREREREREIKPCLEATWSLSVVQILTEEIIVLYFEIKLVN
jgi:hypothetical protein